MKSSSFLTFCIERPVFATILNAMIGIVGIFCLNHLELREYPEIQIPSLTVSASYPNASAEVVESSVTSILEEALAALEGLDSMDSTTTQGETSIMLKFKAGTSLDRSLLEVRDAVTRVRGSLPKDLFEPLIQKSANNSGPPFMAVSFTSTTRNAAELTHYVNLNLKNAFRSLKGIASVQVWGQPYTMAIRLDPLKLYTFGINPNEILTTLDDNNSLFPAGKFRKEVPVSMDLSLHTVEHFENLLIRKQPSKGLGAGQDAPLMLKNLADIKLAPDDSNFRVRLNGKGAVVLALTKSSASNPLETSDLVRAEIQNLKRSLPQDISIALDLDEANFIRASLNNLQRTLLEAVILVLGVIFLFLRSGRATLIPLLAVPISLLGTLVVLRVLGFSLNTLTLLALVLAIGLVVDDAIVVLENIHRNREAGLDAKEAAKKGVREIGFAIIAMTCTLVSVYMPFAFLEGAMGQLFVEFAVALAGAVLLSGVVALTLSPMLCTKVLKTLPASHPSSSFYEQTSQLYERLLAHSLRKPSYTVSTVGILLVVALGVYKMLPHEIAPREDRGLMGIFLPPIAGKDITTLDNYAQKAEALMAVFPEKDKIITFMGDWGGYVIAPLKDWSKRKRTPALLADKLREKVQQQFSIEVYPWSWDTGLPGIDEAGDATGVTLVLQTIGTYKELFSGIDELRQQLEKRGGFKDVSHDLHLNSPGYALDVDDLRLSQAGLTPAQVSTALQASFENVRSLYFQKDTMRYLITLESMTKPWGLDEIYLTNSSGQRISLGTLMRLRPTALPKQLRHYNQMRAATLSIALSPGEDFQGAMKKLEEIKKDVLPPAIKGEWSGMAKAFKESSSAMIGLILMALIFIYAILAMQFESFVDPLIIILTVPLAGVGALLTLWMAGQTMNIYTQIGLITLIGLITKHGILLVEFANQSFRAGKSAREAVQLSASLRLRPILMTTAAMVFGSLPLIFSSGAGNEARRAIGYVLVGGLSLGTVFTLFIIPSAYVVVRTMSFKALSGLLVRGER